MRPGLLLVMVTTFALTGCDKKDQAAPAAAPGVAPSAEPKPATPAPVVAKPAAPAAVKVDPAATAEVAKAKFALEMCGKEMDAVKAGDLKKHDKLVALIRHPRDPADYTKDSDYPFVGTKAAVVVSRDDETVIIIVPDDTDPCAIKHDANLWTAKNNPAAQIDILASKPGDYQSWSAAVKWPEAHVSFGAMKNGAYQAGGFRGQSFVRLTKVVPGKSVELDVHGCEAQFGELMGQPPKYFVIGHVSATWCPKP